MNQYDIHHASSDDARYFCAVKPRILFLLPSLWVQGFLVSPDLMRMPLLLVHYIEHKAASEDLDLASFIALHYADDEHHAQDHSGHEHLPFHHHHGAGVDQASTKVLANEPLRQVSFPALSALSPIALPVDQDVLAGHHPELLRPPRTLA